MARRRVGPAGARALASAPSLAEALATLTATPYGHAVASGQDLAAAQRAVAETTLWNLRVLAGWLPRAGAERVSVLAGWFEITNVEQRLRAIAGRPAAPPFRLGSLATLGSRPQQAGSPAELRRLLAASPWGDPGGETPREIGLALRLAWAERVGAAVPPARGWAVAASGLLVARELFVADRRLAGAAAAAARRLLGAAAPAAASLAELAAAAPRDARAALAVADRPESLWLAEARWWARVDVDAAVLLRRPRFSLDPVVGAAAAAAVDAWRVRAALECAARGGRDLDVFDAVA
jgi:hypothetical protein